MEALEIQTHIPYLEEILLLGAVCYPTVLSYPICGALFPRASREKASTELIISTALSTLVVVLVAVTMAREYVLFLNLPAFWFYPVSVLLGPLCVLFEYIMNGSYLYLKKGYFPNRLSIHPLWAESNERLHLILIFFITTGEELIFRQMMFSLLIGFFKYSFLQTLLFTSFIYAANHIFMGFNSTGTKFLTGMIYGSLYYISGSSIIVPVIVHYIQNITLLRIHWVIRWMLKYARSI